MSAAGPGCSCVVGHWDRRGNCACDVVPASKFVIAAGERCQPGFKSVCGDNGALPWLERERGGESMEHTLRAHMKNGRQNEAPAGTP